MIDGQRHYTTELLLKIKESHGFILKYCLIMTMITNERHLINNEGATT